MTTIIKRHGLSGNIERNILEKNNINFNRRVEIFVVQNRLLKNGIDYYKY